MPLLSKGEKMRVVINDGFEVIWKILASTKDGGMTREELQECFGTDDLNRIKEFGFEVINEKYQESTTHD